MSIKITLLLLVLISFKSFSQNVGIGTTTPLMNLHVASADSAVALLENQQSLNTNISNGLYFKTGNGSFSYTGAIKTIGLATSTARLGLFTYASASPNGLKERMSITDFGNVGINTTNPFAALHVEKSHVLFTGPLVLPVTATAPPVSGAGSRMFWYNDKAAFRTGAVDGTQWDINNVGRYSFASGYNSIASGSYSTAMGEVSIASGAASAAIGYYTDASGIFSIAMGSNTSASGSSSTAMGSFTTASGPYSTAIGNWASTSGRSGSLVIGDDGSLSQNILYSSNDNEFSARFSGGYRFYTNNIMSVGVALTSGGNAWSSISDSTKKEKFKKTDGENVLNSISKMRLGSWNYKSQSANEYRHYGPMAQEFYNAFGNDGIGRIGCDTLIGSADIDGIMMIALQALEKRTNALALENQLLKTSNIELTKEVTRIKYEYEKANKLSEVKPSLVLRRVPPKGN